MSEALETYSPELDLDLAEITVVDVGDLVLDDLDMQRALVCVRDGMAQVARSARLAVMLGGEHTASLGGFRGIRLIYPDAASFKHLNIGECF